MILLTAAAVFATSSLCLAAPSPQAPADTRQTNTAVVQPEDDRPKAGNAHLTIDLKPTALMEGHDVRATIRVTPESSNRLLSVAIDAPTFYASTERELMGASSPRTYTFRWDKLPAGQYTVEAIVTDAAGKLTRVHRDFLVHGGVLDGEMQPTTPNPGRRGRRRQ